MTTEDIEKHIINIMRLEAELVENTGYYIDAEGTMQDGRAYIKAQIGDGYIYTFDRQYGLLRNYEPHKGEDDLKSWKRDIDLSQIKSFALPPKEKAKRKGKGRKAKSKQLIKLYDESGGKSNG